MAQRVKLTSSEKGFLFQAVLYAKSSKLKKRANAILLLDEGYSNEEAAVICNVSAKSIFNWKKRFLENRSKPAYERLSDHPRTGRPTNEVVAKKKLLRQIVSEKPGVHGYEADFWTIRLLQIHIARHWNMHISDESAWQVIKKQTKNTTIQPSVPGGDND